MNNISHLSFLTGSWSGSGFVMDFTQPVQTMMFGSMQAGDEDNKTVYWKTFRFEIADELLLHTITLNKDSGTYVLTKQESHYLEFYGVSETSTPDFKRCISSAHNRAGT